MRLVENSGSKEAWINYIPERNEPMIGEQRMAAASIPRSRAQVSCQRRGDLVGMRRRASLSLDDWLGD